MFTKAEIYDRLLVAIEESDEKDRYIFENFPKGTLEQICEGTLRALDKKHGTNPSEIYAKFDFGDYPAWLEKP